MLYELRIYHIHEGKMPDIHRRFANHTMELFSKHDLRVVDFWEETGSANNKLYYVVEHDNMEARELNFNAFLNDPEWISVKQQSEADGPIVEKVETVYMQRVPYSPLNR